MNRLIDWKIRDEDGLRERVEEAIAVEGFEDEILGQMTAEDDELVMAKIRAGVESALARLTPRQRQVIQLRFGLGEQRPLKRGEVAEILGVTYKVVTKIECRAKAHLRRQKGFSQLLAAL